MIYQCYFEQSQRDRMFDSPVYRCFGLYSQVNPAITRNCPELEDPRNQQLMSEYAAMLHMWRNPDLDSDPWIGFTSYRQLDKFPTVFQGRQELERHLRDADVLGWGFYTFVDAISGQPLTLAEQAERCHPGLNGALWRLTMLHNDPLPPAYLLGHAGLFCNYWTMSKANFHEYMEWSWPLVQYALQNPDDFAQRTPRYLAFLVERLFICWHELKHKRVKNAGQVVTQGCGNPLFGAQSRKAMLEGKETLIALNSWNIALDELCQRHKVAPRGIIHIGAHHAEERDIYQRLGVHQVLWVEADPAHQEQLAANLKGYAGQRSVQACLTDHDAQWTTFFRTSNRGESSSVLPLGTHKDLFKSIRVIGQTCLPTSTFRSLAEREALNPSDYDLLVLDVQGAELLVLKGFGSWLDRIQSIYLEVNTGPVYEGCAQLGEIEKFLQTHGFIRRETLMTTRHQGDALYLRRGSFAEPPTDLGRRCSQAESRLIELRTFALGEVGQPGQPVEFLYDGRIGNGGPQAQSWMLRSAGHDVLLELLGTPGRTAFFRVESTDCWRGRFTLSNFACELRPRQERMAASA